MPKSESNRTPRPKKKKNESLELLRAITKSMAGAIPGVSEETRDTIEDSLARPLSGFASQFAGEDPNEPGKLVFPPYENIKRVWKADERRKAGLPPEKMAIPGMIQDTLSLPSVFGGGPQWAQDASASADRIHSAVDEGMNLAPPKGFRQHALNSAGMMAAQIPVPGSAAVNKADDIGKGALQILKKYGMKALKSPVEFLSPTVDPKMSNYLFGALAGGGIGMLGDEEEPVEGEPVEEAPTDERPPLEWEDLPEGPPQTFSGIARAEGGKVGGLKALLKVISMNPDARVKQTAHQMGDPVEEVLYATNEGQRRGVLSSEQAKRIKEMLASGDEESLSIALMDLHRKLNPPSPAEPLLQALPSREKLVFQDKGYREPVHGAGKLPPVETEVPLLRKAKGGKASMAGKLLEMLKSMELDPHEFDLIDEKGNLRIEDAQEVIEDHIEGSREVDDFVEGLGVEDPAEITRTVQERVAAPRIPDQGEVPDSEWRRIQDRMKNWKVKSVYDLEDLLPTQTTETLRVSIPSMSKWTNWPDSPGARPKKLDILKNPKSQADVERWAGRDVREIRFMTDQDGDTYVWDADKAIHNQVLEALGLQRKGLFHEMSDTPIPPNLFDLYFFTNPWE